MRYWGELKSLRGQSVGEVGLVMRAVFRICGKESQTGLQIVEKLATPLVRASSLLFMMRPRLQDWMADVFIILAILAMVIVRFCGSKISCLLPGALTRTIFHEECLLLTSCLQYLLPSISCKTFFFI